MASTSRKDVGALNESQYPILCETCLGENPYMRMIIDRNGQACKVCNRPFTTYRWCPGPRMRFKRTEICQTCSRAKNICQTCLLDLSFSLPVQARDQLLSITSSIPKSEVNRAYHLQLLEKKLEGKTGEELAEPFNPALCGTSDSVGKEQSPGSKILANLARRKPYYKRNLPHICSFYVKGDCKRGEECPYRHDSPSDPEDPLSQQNIKNRYHGVRDPVAQKILAKISKEEKKEQSKSDPTEFFE